MAAAGVREASGVAVVAVAEPLYQPSEFLHRAPPLFSDALPAELQLLFKILFLFGWLTGLTRLSTFDLSFNFFHADNFLNHGFGAGCCEMSLRKTV